jgi:hypothetical protein
MTMGLTPRQNDLDVYLLEREFEGRVAPTIDEMRDRSRGQVEIRP